MSVYLNEQQASERTGVPIEQLRKYRRTKLGADAGGPEFVWSSAEKGKVALYHQEKLDIWNARRLEREEIAKLPPPVFAGNPRNPKPLLER